ncbi:SDR family oxidoreductase [Paradevosia shaoguanensis]|uniref:SDR family oxidoreductase n=1 Tax=Paradevosia shaoguanensis TaxID=1335043 RepID=UPI001933B486|nr:SDR family oxidoreductase [Paradevosia shaoguanensis]
MSNQTANHRVALVTGAADRIGATLAKVLAANGHKVIVHYRSSSADADAVVAAIADAGGEAMALRADLCQRGERRTLVARAAEPFGPLTLLVNNASLFDPDSVEDLTEELWDMHLAIHLEAPAFLSRDFALQLPADTEGNIVNIVDERVLHLSPAYFSYTLSKAALWDMTRTLAQSLAPRIRVNAIGPGPILPHKRQSDEAFAQSVASSILGRSASPEEIADAVLFLLKSRSMTGQMLALDGGKHLEYRPSRAKTPRV